MDSNFRRLGLSDPSVHAQILRALKTSPGLAAHLADLDPHPQYLQDSDRISWVTEGFTPTTGQTVFTLGSTPTPESVVFIVNGVSYVPTVDYTVSGVTVTWLDTDFTLETTDEVVITYYIDAPVLAGGGSLYLPEGWT